MNEANEVNDDTDFVWHRDNNVRKKQKKKTQHMNCYWAMAGWSIGQYQYSNRNFWIEMKKKRNDVQSSAGIHNNYHAPWPVTKSLIFDNNCVSESNRELIFIQILL